MTEEMAIQYAEGYKDGFAQAKEVFGKQAQADGEYISKSDMIDWLKDIRHKMKPQNYHTASEFEIAENQIWNLIQMLQMGAFPTVVISSEEPKVGRCEDCKCFRKLPLRTDTVGKCIQHWGVCPPCDWFCADFEPQESEGEQPKIIKCPNCGNVQFADKEWCPDCGAKMVEEQESDHTCHTCKHYTSGERDGSCGSYICKGYSNWESEDKE